MLQKMSLVILLLVAVVLVAMGPPMIDYGFDSSPLVSGPIYCPPPSAIVRHKLPLYFNQLGLTINESLRLQEAMDWWQSSAAGDRGPLVAFGPFPDCAIVVDVYAPPTPYDLENSVRFDFPVGTDCTDLGGILIDLQPEGPEILADTIRQIGRAFNLEWDSDPNSIMNPNNMWFDSTIRARAAAGLYDVTQADAQRVADLVRPDTCSPGLCEPCED